MKDVALSTPAAVPIADPMQKSGGDPDEEDDALLGVFAAAAA